MPIFRRACPQPSGPADTERAMAPRADGREPVPHWCLDHGKVLLQFNGQAYFVNGRGSAHTLQQTHGLARLLVEAWRKRHSPSTTEAPVAEIEDYAAAFGLCYRLHADGAAEHQPSLACARNAALELIQSRAPDFSVPRSGRHAYPAAGAPWEYRAVSRRGRTRPGPAKETSG